MKSNLVPLCKARYFFFLFLFFFQSTLYGQIFLPENQPEQDACNAIVVCADSLVVPYSYHKYGQKLDLTSSPCGFGEINSMWLKVEIATSGIFTFQIRPVKPNIDRHEVVVMAANTGCDNLSAYKVIRCTASGVAAGGLVMLNPGNQPLRDVIQANAGDTYYLMINSYGEQLSMFSWRPSSGFTIDFSASTATFVKGNPPLIDEIPLACPNRSRVVVNMTKLIKCNSIAVDGSDFQLTSSNPNNPPGIIYSAKGIGCDLNNAGYASQVKINFQDILPPGSYNIKTKVGTDGNTVLDMCEEPAPVNSNANFIVPVLEDTVSLTVCPNQMPFQWNGRTILTPGMAVARVKITNRIQCDSFTTLNLFVQDTLRETEEVFICPEELPYQWNGQTITDTGESISKFYMISPAGCDSLVTLNLRGIYPSVFDTIIHSCGPYFRDGQQYLQSQQILDTLKSDFGCDSIYLNINLQVHPEIQAVTQEIDTFSCGFLVFEDEIYTQNQEIIDTLYNEFGCDSIYRQVNIFVYPNTQPVKLYDTVSDCNIVQYEGNQFTTDTTLFHLYENKGGCDSLIKMTRIKINHLKIGLSSFPEEPVFGDYVTLSSHAKIPYSIEAWKPQELFQDQSLKQQYLFIHAPQEFVIYGKSEDGCTDSARLILLPDTLIPELVMPTAFTPNNDGLNDFFQPNFISKSGYIVEYFKVYNRMGQLVYQQFSSRDIRWNGNVRGKETPAPSGVYYYQLGVKFINGKEIRLNGEVTLIR